MKPTHNRLLTVAGILITGIATALIFYMIYDDAKEICLNEMNQAFASAVHREKEIRMDRDHLFYSYGKSDASPRQMIIERENETLVLEKPDAVKKMTRAEKQNQADQSFLFEEGKVVNLQTLDSLWRTELQQHRLSVQTAVLYKDNINRKTVYAGNDTLLHPAAWHIITVPLGLRGEITLRGFARPTFLSIIRKDLKRFAAVIIALSVAMICLFFVFRREKTTPVLVQADESTTRLTETGNNTAEQIVLDVDKFTVTYRDQKIKLPEQLFVLFEHLWNNPDHFADYEELNGLLFRDDGDIKIDNRLHKAISRMRKCIKDIPELEIENVPKRGYKFCRKYRQIY